MVIPLMHVRQIDSTQVFLERYSDLTCCGILADSQSCGRGQYGNTWCSELNAGLWLSAALPVPPVHRGILLQRAASAVAAILGNLAIPIGLKWPNDLVAWQDGSLVKVGGIIGSVNRNRVILGIGINIWRAPVISDRRIKPACLLDICPNHHWRLTTEELASKILDYWEDLTVSYNPSFYWPQVGDSVAWEQSCGVCQGWLADGRLAITTAMGVQLLAIGSSNLTMPNN